MEIFQSILSLFVPLLFSKKRFFQFSAHSDTHLLLIRLSRAVSDERGVRYLPSKYLLDQSFLSLTHLIQLRRIISRFILDRAEEISYHFNQTAAVRLHDQMIVYCFVATSI